MQKPHLTLRCVANSYARDGERIAEFSFPRAASDHCDPPGGLIALRYRENGPPVVEIYRAAGCEIRTPAPGGRTPARDYDSTIHRAAVASGFASPKPPTVTIKQAVETRTPEPAAAGGPYAQAAEAAGLSPETGKTLDALAIAAGWLWRIAAEGDLEAAPADGEYDDTESAHANGWSVMAWRNRWQALSALAQMGDDMAAELLKKHAALEVTRDAQDRWDNTQAVAEGWFLNAEGGQIEKDDDSATFEDDDAAADFVRREAAEGSAYHRAALEAIGEEAEA